MTRLTRSGETDSSEADGRRDGVDSHGTKPPLDVRIVAYFFYIGGFAGVLASVSLCSGLIEPDEPYRAFLGTVVLANGLTQGTYALFTALCFLFIAWGLMRAVRLGWWFTMTYMVYCTTEGLLQLPGYPVLVTISFVINILSIGWLWFRREFYGVRPKTMW
jgi:hypothetical protein